jgi:hypothetical protein
MFKNTRTLHTLCIALICLVLFLGSTSQATQAYAAPKADTEISYLVQVWKPKGAVCIGRDYPVKVRVTKFNEVVTSDGQTVWKNSIALAANAQKVNSSVQNSSIGTLTPSEILTGWDLDSPGEANFNFHANEVGSTQLDFKIDIRDYNRDGPIEKTLHAGEQIKVVRCKYKVTIQYSFAAHFPNLDGLVLGTAEGGMKADQSGNLNGTAGVRWYVYWFSKCFTHNTQVSNSPEGNLNGSLSQDDKSLTFHADFEPVTVSETSTATCIAQGGSNSTSAFSIPPIDVTMSSNGGVTVKPLSLQWEGVSLQGSAVVNVIPIEVQ